MKKQVKLHDIVRVLTVPPDSPNARARITGIAGPFVTVSNMNMPLQGTFANEWLHIEDVQPLDGTADSIQSE